MVHWARNVLMESRSIEVTSVRYVFPMFVIKTRQSYSSIKREELNFLNMIKIKSDPDARSERCEKRFYPIHVR